MITARVVACLVVAAISVGAGIAANSFWVMLGCILAGAFIAAFVIREVDGV